MSSVAAAGGPLPVTLLTGFLGMGKTTLLNAVLRDPAFARTMVIVNEFGAVGLDHLLIEGAVDDVLLLDSGCLCCAATGSLRDTLIDLGARRSSGAVPAFDRVIVETSGLANPAPLIATLVSDSALRGRFELHTVLTVVDVQLAEATLERHAEFVRQVAFADRLVLTKAGPGDVAAAEERLSARLSALNPQAPQIRWRRGESAVGLFAAAPATGRLYLRGPMRAQYGSDGSAHGPSFGAVRTDVLTLARATTWPAYAAWSAQLGRRFGARLLRCKGLLAIDDDGVKRWWTVQAVQGHFMPPEPFGSRHTPPADGGYLVCITDGVPTGALAASIDVLAGVDCQDRQEETHR